MKYRSGTQMSPRPLDVRLARRAAQHHGVFSRAEALRDGATPRIIHNRLATGRWERLHPGVYRFSGVAASWRQEFAAACLAAGPSAVASHRAAAVLWQLADAALGLIEISVPRGRRVRLRGVLVHEVAHLPPVDVSTIEGIPVTSVSRTVLDLGAVISQDKLEELLDDALRRGLTTISRLRWRTKELGSRRGTASLRRLLDARMPGDSYPQSVLETRLLRLLKRAGLPEPERQHEIRDRGRLLAVVDFAYPEARIAIEADGYRWHSGRARWERDLARRNVLTSLGWRVIHVTSTDIERRSARIVSIIEAALRGH